jgi:branched-chain amino acid transport system ATP-binding protein
MLEVEHLAVHRGVAAAVRDASFTVAAGEALAIAGPNGAGKSTLLGAIFGTLVPTGGAIRWQGTTLAGQRPSAIARRGIALAPEGRPLAGSLSVRDNLLAGGYVLGSLDAACTRLDELLPAFPTLAARLALSAASLSGGERQMLAIARALMARPTLLLLDEPMLGLAPRARAEIADVLRAVRAQGCSLLLADQQEDAASAIADRILHMDRGRLPAQQEGGGDS